MLPTDDVHLFGNDDAGDALFDAAFSKLSIHRRLRQLLDPATNGDQKSSVEAALLPTQQSNVTWDYHYGTQMHYYTMPSKNMCCMTVSYMLHYCCIMLH